MKTSFSDGDELDILADRISKEADTEEKKKILAEYSSSIETESNNSLEKHFRDKFSKFVMILFYLNTGIVLTLVTSGFIIDTTGIFTGQIKPSERLIDSKVLMVLIAGTVTQTAIAFGVLTQFVFKAFSKTSQKKTTSKPKKKP